MNVNEIRTKNLLAECYKAATLSPDTSTQIGTLLESASGVVQWGTLACNDWPPGWFAYPEHLERPLKYQLIEHAERGAIFKAAKYGIPLKGGTMYATWAACADCARAITSSGLARLVRHYPPLDEATERWLESITIGDQIMKAAGVEIIDVIGKIDGPPILRGGVLFDPAN